MNDDLKNKILQIIDELQKLSDNIEEGITTHKEHDEGLAIFVQAITDILEKDSFEGKKFDAWKQSEYLWRPRTRPGFTQENKKILSLIDFLKEITNYQTIPGEKHFKVGETYQIIRYLSKIFKTAEAEILIVDNYLDSNIFDFIEEIDTGINVLLLTTTNAKPNFRTLCSSYGGSNLNCKIHNAQNHDRYIVIDKVEIYLLGGSLNGIGKNDFTIKKLDDINKITDLYLLWSSIA